MKPGHFMLDGESSETYGAFIQDRPEIESPNRRVNRRTIYGRSGDLPFDEEAYDNTEMELSLYILGTPEHTASDNRDRVHTWFDSGTYMDFIPYFDTTKIYKVMATEFPKFTSKHYHGEGQAFEVVLTVKPYKYYVNSQPVTLTTSGTIENTTSKTSLPVITIAGSGDVTLKVNGRDFMLKGISTDIVLDSQIRKAYRNLPGEEILNENSKTYTRVYPYLDKGVNTISWTGTVSSVKIEPRWRTLA